VVAATAPIVPAAPVFGNSMAVLVAGIAVPVADVDVGGVEVVLPELFTTVFVLV
jgi:hypothetical protein